jgi:hypothetical protein
MSSGVDTGSGMINGSVSFPDFRKTLIGLLLREQHTNNRCSVLWALDFLMGFTAKGSVLEIIEEPIWPILRLDHATSFTAQFVQLFEVH